MWTDVPDKFRLNITQFIKSNGVSIQNAKAYPTGYII